MRKFGPVLLTVAVMAAVIVGLFILARKGKTRAPMPGGRPGTAVTGARILIISPHRKSILKEFRRAFEAWHLERYGAPCSLQWEDRGGTSTVMQFINAEFSRSPQGIGLDIFWGGGAAYYTQLAGAGRLQAYKLPAHMLAAIPARTAGAPSYDAAYRWYGTALSSFGILYNRHRLAARNLPQPKTWADLGAPEFFNEISAADPRRSGSAYAMVDIILQAYGWEKGFEALTRIAGNVRRFEEASSSVTEDVARQDAAAGLAIDFYAMRTILRHGPENVGFALPQGLTPITPDPIGIFTGAPNVEAARRFVEFVMSEAGQRLWILPPGAKGGPVESDLMRIPVLPEVFRKYTAVSTAKYDAALFETTFEYDDGKAAARAPGLKDLYGALFIDPAAELRAAWQAVIARGLKAAEMKRLCTPAVTEAELMEFSARKWADPIERNRKIAEWSREARRRYAELATR